MREANEAWATYVADLVGRRFDGNQSRLAEAAGVASSTVTRWIDGATPSIGQMLSMCETLGIPMPELLLAAGALNRQDLSQGKVLAPSGPPEVLADVAEAIRHDVDLIDEAREHLLRQYELLRRLSDQPGKPGTRRSKSPTDSEPKLRAVAHKGRSEDRAEVARMARRVRAEHERNNGGKGNGK